jgi:hypothetical protein
MKRGSWCAPKKVLDYISTTEMGQDKSKLASSAAVSKPSAAPAPSRTPAAAAPGPDRVCPITREPIVEAGITALGRAYEYAAISKWLESHSSEPVTNELLPHSGLIRVPHAQAVVAEEWVALQAKARAQSEALRPSVGELARWGDPGSDCRSKLAVTHGKVKPARPVGDVTAILTPEWNPSEAQVVVVDASGTSPKEGQRVKGAIFYRCDFTGTSFVGWDFGRVRFVECSLVGTTFTRCVFRGEETLWADCSGTPSFLGCEVEDVAKWVQHGDPARVGQILKARGLVSAEVRARAA